MAAHGVAFGAPQIDLDKLRAYKDKVVGKLTGGLAGMAKPRKVEVVRGVRPLPRRESSRGRSDRRRGQDKTGAKKVVRFDKAIIAAGSQAVKLPFLPDDPRIVDSTGALELRERAEAAAGHRRRHHRPRDGAPCIRRSARASTSSRCWTA